MKKSIILTAAVALLGVTTAFGQATNGSAPIALTGGSCADDFLKPIAGKSYTYPATVDPTGGSFKWWATTDVNFISSGTDNSTTALTTTAGDFTAVGANYNTTGTADNVDLTWSSNRLKDAKTTPTFVVVKYDAPAGSCADNLKVYKIDPINAFTVDVLGMTDANTPATKTVGGSTVPDYAKVPEDCVSNIKSAVYNTGTNAMDYDYGDNKLYFEVVAANFTTEYTPTFKLTGLVDGQTADIKWGYVKGTFDKTVVTGAKHDNAVTTTGVEATVSTDKKVETAATDTHSGVSIYVEVTIHNGTHETTADQNISLSVTGKNSAGESDIKNDDCAATATFADNTSTHKIKKRAKVDPASGTSFE